MSTLRAPVRSPRLFLSVKHLFFGLDPVIDFGAGLIAALDIGRGSGSESRAAVSARLACLAVSDPCFPPFRLLKKPKFLNPYGRGHAPPLKPEYMHATALVRRRRNPDGTYKKPLSGLRSYAYLLFSR